MEPYRFSVKEYFDSGKIAAMKASPYHHGALREALLVAAETILQRDGLNALTLRAAAREAGVTHAAPSYHFGDLTGLLTELAADGYERFGACLRAAIEAPDTRRWDAARAYVAFAKENPALFQLMFRSERLDANRPTFREARMKMLGLLSESRGVYTEQPSVGQLGKMLSGWSLIHGYTMLLLDGRLKTFLGLAPQGTSMDELFDAMLVAVDTTDLGPDKAGNANT